MLSARRECYMSGQQKTVSNRILNEARRSALQKTHISKVLSESSKFVPSRVEVTASENK